MSDFRSRSERERVAPPAVLSRVASLQRFDDFVKAETARWAKIITEANLAGTQ